MMKAKMKQEKRQKAEGKQLTCSPIKFFGWDFILLTYFTLQNKKCDM